jgi:hypothetical protein
MTSLTVSEKERVAVLLGDNVRWQCACGASYETRNQGERNCGDVAPAVTLEACLEYAKGKGWGHTVYWNGSYEAEIFHKGPGLGGPSIADNEDQPDPLTAFVRALLKAEEASRG